MSRTTIKPILLALALLPLSELTLAQNPAPAAAPQPAPLVKQGVVSPTGRPQPAPGASPVQAYKPPLYDPARADPMKPPATAAAPTPNLPPPMPGLMGPGGFQGGPGMPGMGMNPGEETPEKMALERAKTDGTYLGIMGHDRVWRLKGMLYFEKIPKKKKG